MSNATPQSSYIATIIIASVVFLTASVFGILTGLKESTPNADKDTFAVGYTFQGAILAGLILFWVLYMTSTHNLSWMLVAASGLMFTFVGIGWGGMMGYRSGMTDADERSVSAAFFLIPIAAFIWAMYTQYMMMNPGNHHMYTIMVSFVLSAIFIASGSIFFNKNKFKDGVKPAWYDAYAWLLIGAGIVLFLSMFFFGNKLPKNQSSRDTGVEMTKL